MTDRVLRFRRPRYYPRPRPAAVSQAQQRLANLEPDDQAILLAWLAYGLASTAQGLTIARPVEADALKARVRFFTGAQEQIAYALVQTLLRSRVALDVLISDLYNGAFDAGCGDEVALDIQRALSAPLRRQRCPCCGYYTLLRRGEYTHCPVCFWEDEWPALEFGEPPTGPTIGANRVPLEQARMNFSAFGAKERRALPYVRPPLLEELPENQPPEPSA